MKKKITIIITLLIILSIVICMLRLKNFKDKSLRNININDQNLTFIFETDNGEVTGSGEDWLSDKYADYVLDKEKSSCNGDSAPFLLNWDNEKHTVLLTSNENDRCTLYFEPKKPSVFDNCEVRDDLVECIKSLDNNAEAEFADGDGYLYHHNSLLKDGAGDNGYRYSGDNPNNFVCFGPGAEDYSKDKSNGCDFKNLYRIIGIVPVEISTGEKQNLVKLIQSEYATPEQMGENALKGKYKYNDSNEYENIARVHTPEIEYGFYWNSEDNMWSDEHYNYWEKEDNGMIKKAPLNETLNNEYIKYLQNNKNDITWIDKIETVKWNVGGSNSASFIPKEMYVVETTKGNGNTTGAGLQAKHKIGLMYIHDYAFANDKKNWTVKLDSYNYENNMVTNWLFNGVYEWTISSWTWHPTDVFGFGIGFNSSVRFYNSTTLAFGVRPVFYLKSDVKIKADGTTDGSMMRPYKIVLK